MYKSVQVVEEEEEELFTDRLVGSWTSQNTYVCITSSPPSFAFAIRSGHICREIFKT